MLHEVFFFRHSKISPYLPTALVFCPKLLSRQDGQLALAAGVGEDGFDVEGASLEQEAVMGGEVGAVAEGEAVADGVEEGLGGEVLVPFEGVDGGPDGVEVVPGLDAAAVFVAGDGGVLEGDAVAVASGGHASRPRPRTRDRGARRGNPVAAR